VAAVAARALTHVGAMRDDIDLIGRVGVGDERARRELFAAYGERVWRIVFRLVGDYDDAHDLTQETFLRAFDRAASYDARGSVLGWLARIALNLARDDLRRRRRRRDILEARPHPGPPVPGGDPLVAARVRAAVDTLSDVERVVVLMHDLEEYTHEEIADALGIAPGSSRARLSRARARLREALHDTLKEVPNE
jgi:RNA polymerase sigma-70 factor, ECF subfamily